MSAPDANGWTEWLGGDCPLPAKTEVEVRFRGGVTGRGQSAFIRWWHEDDGSDIIAYRVVPAPSNHEEAQ